MQPDHSRCTFACFFFFFDVYHRRRGSPTYRHHQKNRDSICSYIPSSTNSAASIGPPAPPPHIIHCKITNIPLQPTPISSVCPASLYPPYLLPCPSPFLFPFPSPLPPPPPPLPRHGFPELVRDILLQTFDYKYHLFTSPTPSFSFSLSYTSIHPRPRAIYTSPRLRTKRRKQVRNN